MKRHEIKKIKGNLKSEILDDLYSDSFTNKAEVYNYIDSKLKSMSKKTKLATFWTHIKPILMTYLVIRIIYLQACQTGAIDESLILEMIKVGIGF